MGLPRVVRPMLEALPWEVQRAVTTEYNSRRKSKIFAYLAWLFLGWHYLYLRRLGLQFAFWLTLGGFSLWWIIDIFRVGPMVNRLNEDCARGLLAQYLAITVQAPAPHVAPSNILAGATPPGGEETYSEPIWLTLLSAVFLIVVISALLLFSYAMYTTVPTGQTYDKIMKLGAERYSTSTEVSTATLPLSSDSPWVLAETTDRMTDVHSFTASRQYNGAQYSVRAAVKCVGVSQIVYEFKTYDADNDGVLMSSMPDTIAMSLITGGLIRPSNMIKFLARIDAAKATSGYVFNPKYGNVLTISPKTIGVSSTDLAKGSKVMIRLPTRGGEETIEIDQSDSNIRDIFEQCGGQSFSTAEEEQTDAVVPSGDRDDAKATSTGASDYMAAKCSLEVNGVNLIMGTCSYGVLEGGGGSFQISQDVPGGSYFAYILKDGATAKGYWNGSPGSSHAHDELGIMKRDGGCWVNDKAKICAWKL